MVLPTILIPGFLAGAREYRTLEAALITAGIPTATVPLTKTSWLPTIGGRSVTPIVQQIHHTVCQMQRRHNVERVNLIGHSAGGWIARIYLGDRPYDIHGDRQPTIWHGWKHTASLVTLGTPHSSQERWTRRNLDFVENTYPGSFHRSVRYICVAGKAIYGRRRWGSWFAYNSYQLTCGRGDCWGDGITPIVSAHLDGATNLTLEGVLHAPTSDGPWYGSKEHLNAWIDGLS
ncbi:MAG: alpha/beta hydrolase [Cyanobacteria bacterium J06641_5]